VREAAVSKKTPFLSQLIRPTRQEYDSRKLPTIVKRFFALVIGSLFVLVGLGLLFVRPWSILTCYHMEPRQIDCRLEKRIAWLFPVEERSISGLRDAVLRWERATRIEEDGERTGYLVYDVVLVSDSGEASLAQYDPSWSNIAHSTAARLKGYLQASGAAPLTLFGHGLWLHTVSTLGGCIILLLFSFALMTSTVNSLLLLGAWAMDCALSAVGWVVDSVGAFSEANDQIARLLQAVRGVAIQPEGNDSAQTQDQSRESQR